MHRSIDRLHSVIQILKYEVTIQLLEVKYVMTTYLGDILTVAIVNNITIDDHAKITGVEIEPEACVPPCVHDHLAKIIHLHCSTHLSLGTQIMLVQVDGFAN